MKTKWYNLRFLVIILIFLFFNNSCQSDIMMLDRDIRYIHSFIKDASKQKITLQDGTKWGFGHISVNTPGDEVIVVYYESSLGGTVYIKGIEYNVTFLGASYNFGGTINDIMKYNDGTISYITEIDTSGKFISLDNRSDWVVRPDQRTEVKKWNKSEKVIIDMNSQFIINPRIYQMAAVQQVKIEDNK